MAQEETVLVTGAMGCIGSWTIAHLVRQGKQVIAFDLSPNKHRLDLLLEPGQQDGIRFVEGDLTDYDQVTRLFESHSIHRVIHLAALQVPFCRADPVAGATVNVLGTAHLFEACLRAGIEHLAYASSAAVYGPLEGGSRAPVPEEAAADPMTLYGVFKQANEGQARNYWQDYGLSSTALRPHTVYGPGRDQGMTSDPTKAMLAAAAGLSFQVKYGSAFQLQYASDVALQFIAAGEDPKRGAFVFNLGGEAPSMDRLIEIIRGVVPGADIGYLDVRFPIPEVLDDSRLRSHFETVYETSPEDGIEKTIRAFQDLLSRGKLAPPSPESE